MRCSFAVCSLAVVLCLVVCVCASTTVSKTDATREVAAAKQSVTDVCARAQTQFDKANNLLNKVESYKREATEAKVKSQEAPQDNTDAIAIAKAIKSLSDEVDELYPEAKAKLEEAIKSLNRLLSDAQKLNGKPDIKIEPDTPSTEDYTGANGEATTLKGQATALNGQIDTAVEPIAGVDTTVNDMEQKAKEAQLKDAHVSAIVAVAKIETMLRNANNIILQIEEKKNAVSGIVEEMKTFQTNPTTVSDDNIKALHTNADNALTAAKGAAGDANSAKADIQKQKDLASEALTKFTAEKQEVSKAQGEVRKAQECVRAAEVIVPRLETALQTADNSVTNANGSKENLKTALSKATSATRPEQSVTNPKVKTLKGSVSSAVTEIQTLMGEAEGTLQKTENHKQTVHDIVKEMKTLKTTANIVSNEVNKLCKNAEGELTIVTSAVEKVKTEMGAMRKEKEIADAALIDVNAATDTDKAQQQADTATSCIDKVKENIAQVRSALQIAKTSVAKTNELKQKLMTILSTTTTAPRTKEVKDAEKSDPPVAVGTEPDQKDTTTQPTLTNTEQPASKEPLDQGDNSTAKIKDKLIKGAQNVPTTALTDGKAPAPGAKNDSAMTVSVPLLVALIASAVWQ